MFDNRAYGLKLTGALLVIAGLGIFSALRGDAIHPALWRCVAEPARWDGAPLWLPGATVRSSDLEGFEIDVDGARARVVPAAPVAPGATIDLAGTFRARGPIIEARELRRSTPEGRSRLLSEVVSVAVLALVLLNFLRHFVFRPKAVQVRGVD